MILDLSTINFVGGGGESSAPAGKVETVEVNITMNGVENPTLNEGFTAFGDVTVNSDNVTNSSALLFTKIGYSEELNTELNAKYNADIAYSKEVLDKWNNGEISNFNYDTKLIYCPKIDTSNAIGMYYMFSNCVKLQFVPLLDTSNVTTMSNMFKDCSSLITIPQLDTSNVTEMNGMFDGCSSLQSIPQLNTSNVTNMSYMFDGCSSLQSVPLLDTSNVTNMDSIFYECKNLKSIPLFDTSNVTKMNSMFYSCTSLESLPLLNFQSVTNVSYFFGFSTIYSLTDLGGFKDLKIDWNDNYGSLTQCPNLTYQSVMNVLNNLYDFRANGDDITTKTLKLHSNSYNLLSADDIAMVNAKGWNIQS